MGEFDVATQRRTKNLEELTVLPAAEVLPFAAEGGRDAMLARMEHAAAQLAKKVTTEKTAAAITRGYRSACARACRSAARTGYLAARLPGPPSARRTTCRRGRIVLVCEGSRVMERAKGCAFEWGDARRSCWRRARSRGSSPRSRSSLRDLTRRLRGSFPLLLCDSLPTSRYPEPPPRALLSINGAAAAVLRRQP